MWQMIKVVTALGLLLALVYLTVVMASLVLTTAYYKLFPPIEAEELTVWAEVPPKTFEEKDYHMQTAENERQFQWTASSDGRRWW
jgi:hypothetical protein